MRHTTSATSTTSIIKRAMTISAAVLIASAVGLTTSASSLNTLSATSPESPDQAATVSQAESDSELDDGMKKLATKILNRADNAENNDDTGKNLNNDDKKLNTKQPQRPAEKVAQAIELSLDTTTNAEKPDKSFHHEKPVNAYVTSVSYNKSNDTWTIKPSDSAVNTPTNDAERISNIIQEARDLGLSDDESLTQQIAFHAHAANYLVTEWILRGYQLANPKVLP